MSFSLYYNALKNQSANQTMKGDPHGHQDNCQKGANQGNQGISPRPKNVCCLKTNDQNCNHQ